MIPQLKSDLIQQPEIETGYLLGSIQGIQAPEGTNCGPVWIFQRSASERINLSVGIINAGGSSFPGHLESLSAMLLLWPAIWDVSTSIPVVEINKLSFLTNKAKGMEV